MAKQKEKIKKSVKKEEVKKDEVKKPVSTNVITDHCIIKG